MAKRTEQDNKAKAGGITAVILSVVLAMLLLISWKVAPPEEALLDEGIEVNLGNSDFGLGDVPPMVPGDPAPEAGEPVAAAPPASMPEPAPAETDEDNDDADAVVLPKKQPTAVAKPKAATTQPVTTPKPTTQPPAPAPPKPKATMGSYAGGQGTGGNSQDAFNNVRNQGVAGGTGDQGKANGNINSDNYNGNGGRGNSGVTITKGLTGRSIVRFPSFEDDFNENAKIAMNLRVDESGKVISAEYSATGSTSSNTKLKEIAKRKALSLKFNDGEGESICTVVFNFRLKN
jgi:outer membrane biosynthesis protein TonB